MLLLADPIPLSDVIVLNKERGSASVIHCHNILDQRDNKLYICLSFDKVAINFLKP